MICSIIFSVLESVVSGVSEWCSRRLSILMKCWIWLFFVLLFYVLVLVIIKFCLWLCKYFEDSSFNDLYEAAQSNDMIKVISILDTHPEYVNKFKYPDGYTPFMVACSKANTQMVKFMLKVGADVALKSKNQETAFYLAAFYYIQNKHCSNATCIRELYYAGANINEPSKNNFTPLQLAAIFGHTALIKWLLSKNANLKTCPHPVLLAKSQGHHEAAKIINASMQIISIDNK